VKNKNSPTVYKLTVEKVMARKSKHNINKISSNGRRKEEIKEKKEKTT
jgi:hypothetical protein